MIDSGRLVPEGHPPRETCLPSCSGARLISSIPVLLIVIVGTFLLLEAAPGDAVDAYLAVDRRRRCRHWSQSLRES